MRLISGYFLSVKHRQLFAWFFCLFFVAEVGNRLSALPSEQVSLLDEVTTALLMSSIWGWFWSVGSFLGEITPPTLHQNIKFLRFAVIYSLLYIPIFIWDSQRPTTKIFLPIIPLHFLYVFCWFYCMWFVSKNLAQVEMGENASFYDYAGPFFLLWLFPIGIWFVQPKINRLYLAHKDPKQLTPAITA